MAGQSIPKSLGALLAFSAALLIGTWASVASAQEVSFKDDVFPILELRCAECHKADGAGLVASGLDLTSYEGIMAGTKHGAIVIPGKWMESNLLAVIEHRANPAIWMPYKRGMLSKCEILQLRFWVLQGARNN